MCVVDSLADLLASQGVEGIDEMDADTDELLDALEEADGGGGYKVSPSLLVTRTNPYPNPSPDPDLAPWVAVKAVGSMGLPGMKPGIMGPPG